MLPGTSWDIILETGEPLGWQSQLEKQQQAESLQVGAREQGAWATARILA